MPPVLELDQLSKSFGAIVVSDALSYSLNEGEALGVIGPNGAGKTSMFNLITGALKPDSGEIRFAGKVITNQSAPARCRMGIARSYQIPQPFGGMSVFENVLVAATQGAGLRGRPADELSITVLEQTQLMDKANVVAGTLTLIERKRLELARALAAKPKILLLDEIAGGLTEQECQDLVGTITDIRATGVSIIWIEHIVHALLAVVDRLIVIDFGKMIAQGDPKTTMESQQVQEIYMGIEADA